MIGRLLCWAGWHKPDRSRMGSMPWERFAGGHTYWALTRTCLRCRCEYVYKWEP